VCSDLALRVEDQLRKADQLYYRLILVVGGHRAGKTAALRAIASRYGWPLVNVNLALSEGLIHSTTSRRALQVDSLMRDQLREHDSEVVLLDNLEILFHPQLQLDPLRLLQSLARNRKLVAAWSGDWINNALIYAEPGHPEFRRYPNPEAVLVRANPGRDVTQLTGDVEPS
jgi:hypothetical protein